MENANNRYTLVDVHEKNECNNLHKFDVPRKASRLPINGFRNSAQSHCCDLTL
jgi:hypothetical protein